MLENGGPFVLSSDTLNIIEGGDLNIFGSGRLQQQSSTTQVTQSTVKQTAAGSSDAEVKKTALKLVQHAPSHGKCMSFFFRDLLACYLSCAFSKT